MMTDIDVDHDDRDLPLLVLIGDHQGTLRSEAGDHKGEPNIKLRFTEVGSRLKVMTPLL